MAAFGGKRAKGEEKVKKLLRREGVRVRGCGMALARARDVRDRKKTKEEAAKKRTRMATLGGRILSPRRSQRRRRKYEENRNKKKRGDARNRFDRFGGDEVPFFVGQGA